MQRGISPEFMRAMQEAEEAKQREREAAMSKQSNSTAIGLVDRFRPVIEAGIGSLDGHSSQVLEACCHGAFDELVEAEKAHEVCARCPGLQACEFLDGYRPAVTPFVDGSGFYVAQSACEYKQVEIRRLEFEGRTSQSRLPPRYRRCRFDTYQPNNATRKAMARCQEYAERFDEATERGLYLMGGVGGGKTHLAVATVQRVIDRGYKGRFLLVPEWLREIKQTFGQSSDEQRNVTQAFEFDGLLVVDDIGAEKPSDWVEEQMYLAINHRYTHLLPTIFTSNLGPVELESRLGERISSRILEMCDGVLVNADDYRKRGLGGAAS